MNAHHSLTSITALLVVTTTLTSLVPSTSAAPVSASTSAASSQATTVVAEVVVQGVEGELRDRVYQALQVKPGTSVTPLQLEAARQAIVATGYFANVQVDSGVTPLGTRITFWVEPYPKLSAVDIPGTKVLPASVVAQLFQSDYGQVVNLRQLEAKVNTLLQWYKDQGYVLAQVIEEPKVSPDGRVTLAIAEGEIEQVQVKFLNDQGATQTTEGQPVKGRTRDFIITREMRTQPGTVFNRKTIESDLQRVAGLGIFKDLKVSLEPGQNPKQAIVVVNAAEQKTFLVSPSVSYSVRDGVSGGGTVQLDNFGGNNQRLAANVNVGQRGLQYDLSFADPWIAGDKYRTSYSVNAFKQQSVPIVFDSGNSVRLPNDDRPRLERTGGSVTLAQPLSQDPLQRSEWTASAGVQYQRVRVEDADGKISPVDALGNPLSFSGTGKDDILTGSLAVTRDRRNDRLQPTQGSLLKLSTEQSIPIGQGNILFNRLKGNYSFYLPSRITRFTSGCRTPDAKSGDCPQAFAFNVQGGTVIGDLPPYEAFSLGGANSVRGYSEGDVAAARSYLQVSAEYRFPIVSFLSGTLFVDAATDLGSSASVIGDPGGVRGKPGSGFGYGGGLRIKSPLGPVRVDLGWNDQGDRQVQFGIGERF